MKSHTTNYKNVFIEQAEDCPATQGEIPPLKKGKKTIANLQFERLYENPYKYTSDEILFLVFAERNMFDLDEIDEQKVYFFSKGQPCFRTSPLTKRYGWGVHSDDKGRIAIYGIETDEYNKFLADNTIVNPTLSS